MLITCTDSRSTHTSIYSSRNSHSRLGSGREDLGWRLVFVTAISMLGSEEVAGFPQSWKSMGTKSGHGKSWEMGQKNKVMEI